MESVGVVYKFACDVLANQDVVEAKKLLLKLFSGVRGDASDRAAAGLQPGRPAQGRRQDL